MLDDREQRVLAGIERELSHTSPGLDQLMVDGRKSWLPHVLLGVGLIGFFVAPIFMSGTMTGRVLLAVASATLMLYGLFQIPVRPDLPSTPPATRPDDEDV